MTTLENIDKAEKIAEEITKRCKGHGIYECIVDDYNKHNSFSLIVHGKFHRNFNLRTIYFLIKKVMNENGITNYGYDAPNRTYCRSFGQSTFSGYTRNYIILDVTII